MVRFDAGYPGEELMGALEARGTHYVARVRNNAVLKRLALPAVDALAWEALLAGRPYEGGPIGDRSPKPVQNNVLRPHLQWVSRIVWNRTLRSGLVNNPG